MHAVSYVLLSHVSIGLIKRYTTLKWEGVVCTCVAVLGTPTYAWHVSKQVLLYSSCMRLAQEKGTVENVLIFTYTSIRQLPRDIKYYHI